jgi:PAS domain S-box-containing protein
LPFEETLIGVMRRRPRPPRPRWARYGMAVLCVGAAVLLERSLAPFLGPMPMALYFPAVLVAAWFGGLGPGLLATALSLAAPDLLSASSPLASDSADPLEALRRFIFAVVGVITSWLNEVVYRQRLQLEAAVADAQESEKRFRLTADYAPMMVWMAGRDMARDWFNRRWLEFRGRTLEEELGEGWMAGVHPDDRQQCLQARQSAIAERQPFELEYRLQRHDGEYRWILDQGVPRQGSEGRFAGFIGCCLDVESIKRAQAENERLLAAAEESREEADAASRAKDIFLATVSHELRNPLNAIVGWAHILRGEGASPAEIKQGADIIAQSAQAQVRLIEELLDVSRIITGTMRLNRRLLDVQPIVTAAVDAMRPAAAAKDLHLELRAPQPALVLGDADRLRQVVTNLVSNAINYTPQGGRIEVELRSESLETALTVSDSGVGIAPEFLPHVFEAFRQAETSSRRSHRGLGIGLSVVRHLVHKHGGRVTAHSDGPGRGSRFTVRLPIAEAAPSSSAGPVPAGTAEPDTICPPKIEGMRVLVVDDDSAALQLLEKLLSDCDAVVLTTGSVREALKAVPRFRPDVILSDIQMPGADGYDFIRELRRLPAAQGGATPAAALTAFAGEADSRAVLEAGFELHLTKPVDPQALLAALADLGRGRFAEKTTSPGP